MEDHNHNNHTIIENNNCSSSSSSKAEKNSNSNSNSNSSSNEPVRSRWTPKPEQILILESIFNSGMVNPPKEETVRIRKVLEKFGAVGDANVFYWFQNRRSRSRRRQRQLQASLAAATQQQQQHPPTPQQHQHNLLAPPPPPPSLFGSSGGASLYDFGHHHHHQSSTHSNNNIISNNNTCTTTGEASSSSVTCFAPSSSCSSTNTAAAAAAANLGDCCGGVEDVFGSFSAQMGLIMPTHHHQPPNLEFQSGGIITVFINGVATQVPDGPFDMKAMFGEELMLVHSSGVPVPYNDFGISFHSLQHGESYFLVPRLA